MPNIPWIEDHEADGDLATILDTFRAEQGSGLGPVLRTLTHNPPALAAAIELSRALLFNPGPLDFTLRQMIAEQVGVVLEVDYCVIDHSKRVANWGRPDAAEAIRRGEIIDTSITDSERALLAYVTELSIHPGRSFTRTIGDLRECGWTYDQIAATTALTAVMSMMARLVAAFGLDHDQPK